MFNKSSIILFALIISLLVLDPFVPILIKEVLYSTSLSIKSIIIFVLPFIIFGLLFKTIIQFSNGATKIIALIIALVCCSNFFSTFLSHFVGEWVYQFDLTLIKPNETSKLNSLWNLKLPSLISNDIALFSAIGIGIFMSKFASEKATVIAHVLESFIQKILLGIVYLIPFFILGFIVKMRHDGTILYILKDYAQVFGVIFLSQFTYIFLVFLILNRLSISKLLNNLKNMFPSVLSGFTTMSSAASMPLAIMGVKANTKNKDLASSTVPMTVNIHLVGDCFAIPVLAYAVLKGFHLPSPTLAEYLIFSFYFVLAKFSVAAIPGGGILVMLPILERFFGFNAEMLSLITALYILFDPVITSANILGNGAFAKLIDNTVKTAEPATLNYAKAKS